MKKILMILFLFCVSVNCFAYQKEFARGQYKDKNNKTWFNTVTYEIAGVKQELESFIIGKKIIEIKEIGYNKWIVVVEQ